MISRFFIDRPVFASVISIVIVLAGVICMRVLPIAQYPDILPPEVVVSANYPGATAEVLATTVAAPLEQQINGVPNMLYMSSTSSSSGTLSLTVTFAIGTDPDQATIDVNNRVQAAEARLPEEVRRQGVVVNKRSSSILAVVQMYSPDGSYDNIFVSNYALLNVIDEIKRLPGVGDASLFGAKDYSMRVWLRPDKLAQYKMTPADVAAAIQEQNSQFAAGQFGQEPMTNPQAFTYNVTTQGRFSDVKQFEEIILRSDANGAVLRVKDIARVELGAQDYGFNAKFNGKNATPFGVYLQPGANALEVTTSIRKKMEELSKTFPEGIAYDLPFDTTKFVQVSINEVISTFIEAILLVTLVVFLFLQNVRATLIPLLAVPVSLIGTFAGMYLLGFSINLLTLFGLVLAIGIVVDDAIVVLENVERLMTTEKLKPRDAAIKAMEEVTGPVIAIVLVLCAVFVPVGFMGGLTGVMYKQFAITIAVSVIISGIVALTLTPAMCALLLKPVHREPNRLFRAFNNGFEKITNGYMGGVRFFLNNMTIGFIAFAGIVAATIYLFISIPSSLVPEEDQGYVLVVTNLLPGTSLSRTSAATEKLTQQIMAQAETSDVITFSGFDMLSRSQKSSAGASFVMFKPWEERHKEGSDSKSLAGRFIGIGMGIKDAFTIAFNPPPITGMSMTGGFEGFLQSRKGDSPAKMAENVNKLVAAAAKNPQLAGVRSTFSGDVPQYFLELDRQKAKALNVPVNSVFAAMQSTFGNYYVNDFTLYGRIFRVYLSSEADFRRNPEDLRQVFVRSDNGNMIPLDSLVKVNRIIGPDLLDRFNIFPAAKMMGGGAPGISSGQAIEAMEQVVKETFPNRDYTLAWTGAAYQEKAAGGSSTIAFVFGLIMVFLILAAQYERWSLPIAVLTAVPFAIFGAVLAVWMRGLNNDVYFQVGILTLIALGAKNAILIVEFAVILRNQGKSIMEAALTAAQLRFRPIIMTSLAFILGCIPLAISSGAGAASRHSIGTGVIGGMLAATLIATFFIPMFYEAISKMSERKEKPHPTPEHDHYA